MSEPNKPISRYTIRRTEYGAITVEAPTKEDVLEIFNKVSNVKCKCRIDEDIV
jgi:hypothetical protein